MQIFACFNSERAQAFFAASSNINSFVEGFVGIEDFLNGVGGCDRGGSSIGAGNERW